MEILGHRPQLKAKPRCSVARIEEGLAIPIMFMNPASEPSTALYRNMTGPVYRLDMSGVSGWSYGDFALWPGFPEQELGEVAPSRAAEVVNAYALAFFGRYLFNDEAPLLDGPSPDFPEVDIQTRN